MQSIVCTPSKVLNNKSASYETSSVDLKDIEENSV